MTDERKRQPRKKLASGLAIDIAAGAALGRRRSGGK